MDEYNKSQVINILGIIISLISIVVGFFGQFMNPQTGMIFFIGILIFVALYFIVSYPIAKFIQSLNQIKKNNLSILEIRKDLNNLKDKISIIIDNAKLDARISFLEENLIKMKNKKGQIDPRWIILIIILILLLLYLRSKGII